MKFKILFFISIIFCFPTECIFGSIKYRIVDLGIPNVRNTCIAKSINDKSQICGTYFTEKDMGIFFWDPVAGFQDIGVKNVRENPIINNNGVIAGNYDLRDEKGVFVSHSIFLWSKKDGFSEIGLKSGKYQWVIDLNNQNHVLFGHHAGNNERCLYLCFSPLGSLFSDAKINDNLEIFGLETLKNGTVLRKFDLKTGDYEDIFFFKGSCSLAGFNNAGVAVGEINTFYDNRYGFTWSQENGFELSDTFFPICINDIGQIVGYEKDKDHWAAPFMQLTILDKGEKININRNLDLEFDSSTPWSCITSITDINNRGYMVGTATQINGSQHAVLLIPLNENLTYLGTRMGQ